MEAKIEQLKKIQDNIETMIWFLEGVRKEYLEKDGTVSEELDCYKSEGTELQAVIDSLFQEHGSEMLPVKD